MNVSRLAVYTFSNGRSTGGSGSGGRKEELTRRTTGPDVPLDAEKCECSNITTTLTVTNTNCHNVQPSPMPPVSPIMTIEKSSSEIPTLSSPPYSCQSNSAPLLPYPILSEETWSTSVLPTSLSPIPPPPSSIPPAAPPVPSAPSGGPASPHSPSPIPPCPSTSETEIVSGPVASVPRSISILPIPIITPSLVSTSCWISTTTASVTPNSAESIVPLFTPIISLSIPAPIFIAKRDVSEAAVGYTWNRVAYYTSSSPAEATGFAFLANLGDPQKSGTFDYSFGNSLGYVSSTGDRVVSEKTPFSGNLATSEQEIAVFTDQQCGTDCEYARPMSTAYRTSCGF